MRGESEAPYATWVVLSELNLLGGIRTRLELVRSLSFWSTIAQEQYEAGLDWLIGAGFVVTDGEIVMTTKTGEDAACEWIPF